MSQNALESLFEARWLPRPQKATSKGAEEELLSLLLGGQIESKSIKNQSYFSTVFFNTFLIDFGAVLTRFRRHFPCFCWVTLPNASIS